MEELSRSTEPSRWSYKALWCFFFVCFAFFFFGFLNTASTSHTPKPSAVFFSVAQLPAAIALTLYSAIFHKKLPVAMRLTGIIVGAFFLVLIGAPLILRLAR
ncbi:MAG: hypothetical protein ACLFWL_14420 [Candidatus Brocadiia bacterium]